MSLENTLKHRAGIITEEITTQQFIDMIHESFNPGILETMKQAIENQLESISQPHLNSLEDAIKNQLSPLGDVSVRAAENDANERVFGSVTFREQLLPDLNKIKSLLKQVKGPNGEDLDIQITPGQINYEYEKEYDEGRVFYPKFSFTAKK